MKDAVHHLKHVQKKVIQSSRKSPVSEEISHSEVSSNQSIASLLELPNRSKKRHLNNQLRKSFVKVHVH